LGIDHVTYGEFMHEYSAWLDQHGEAQLEAFFEIWEYSTGTEVLLRRRMAEWKAKELAKAEAFLLREGQKLH
jgi:hypothetical protein